ncbi:MAG: hypothetical protein FJY16_06635 [Bacteroidetes bacterium]|nr:hypothetical protein [Bacteroidota bacterium]
MKQGVTNQIEKILGSLDQVNRATLPPYFYSRLRTRMEAGKQPSPEGFTLRPAFAILVLSVMLAINIYLLVNQSGTHEPKWTELNDQSQWEKEYVLQESTPYQEISYEWDLAK